MPTRLLFVLRIAAVLLAVLLSIPALIYAARKIVPSPFVNKLYFSFYFACPLGMPSKVEIAALGDSLVYRMPWRLLFPLHDIVNLGIPAITTTDLLKRIEDLEAWRPRRIFLLVGINDLRQGISVDQLVSRYEALAAAIRGRTESLYISSLLPTNDAHLQKKITEANEHLGKICRGLDNCRFVDLHASLSHSGKLRDIDTLDGTHLTLSGYFRMWQQLPF